MAARDIQFGIVLPTRDFIMRPEPEGWRRAITVAERAEAQGYDSVWMGDSLVAKPRLEVFTLLSWVGARTRRVGLGTAVYLPTLREPVQLAHSVACLDLLSEGRVTLGMGFGGRDPSALHEYQTVGVDPDRRTSRLEETLAVLRRLWTEDAVTHAGKHFQLENVTLLPKPKQPRGPRLLLSVGNSGQLSPRQARRVVELGDGMFPSRATPEQFRAAWDGVLAEAAARGRDPATLTPALYWTIHLDDSTDHATREADEWLEAYYNVRRPWGTSFGPPSLLREHIEAYHEAGVRLFVVRFAAWDPLAQLERFTNEVYAHYRPAQVTSSRA